MSLEVQDLKVFGHQRRLLLNIESLCLQEGSFNVITGPSGAGKSTLLFALAGLQPKTTGKVIWHGQNISALSVQKSKHFRRQQIGFLFQDFLLFDELSALENATLATGFSNRKKAQSIRHQASSLMERMGLKQQAPQSSKHLSGGERQRIALARALAHDPKIILADEPTASLDRDNSEILVSHLKAIAKAQNKTLIIVSHDTQIHSAADQLIKIKDGQVQAQEDQHHALQA